VCVNGNATILPIPLREFPSPAGTVYGVVPSVLVHARQQLLHYLGIACKVQTDYVCQWLLHTVFTGAAAAQILPQSGSRF
jgi:hypothetical protein